MSEHARHADRVRLELPERIITERLVLRRPRMSDAQSVFEEYARDPEMTRYAAWRPLETVQQAEEFLEQRVLPGRLTGEEFNWALTHEDSDALIGMIACRPDAHKIELGYVLGRGYWNRGYATEAAHAVVLCLFSYSHVYRVWATCDIDNLASVRVLEKIGMTREGTLRRWVVRPNISPEPRDAFLFAKVR